ncbi:MAG: sigma factor-like helix-turn-helix DNA-binding protein [Desertimonas sp.]
MTSHADTFMALRPRLFGIAYRMLGRVTEAEDVLGDVAERWLAVDTTVVRSAEAWLVTATTRRALDVAKSARLSRVDYPGEWLPEPLPTGGDDPLEQRETLTMGFLVLLERLTPLERAVFVLHDVLDEPYPAVADAVGRSEAACRQTLRRARRHVELPTPIDDADRTHAQAVAERFLAVTAGGDIDDLIALLAPDIVVTSDGGGVVAAGIRPVVGLERAARLTLNLAARGLPAPFMHPCELNGEPGVLVRGPAGWLALVVSAGADDRVRQLWAVLSPAKLQPLLDALGDTVAGQPDAARAAGWLRHRHGRPVHDGSV